MKYRKKPVVIEALQFNGNFAEIEKFIGGDAEFRVGKLLVPTLEGPLFASPNDYIIKGIRGEFYPCKPDIFEATYELVSEDVPDSWLDRCSNDGYERYTDENGDRRYVDNDEKVSDKPFRPCARCNQYPNEDGDDFCIQRLGTVMNACCGHGNREGYIQFDNGITIRGYFRVERNQHCSGEDCSITRVIDIECPVIYRHPELNDILEEGGPAHDSEQ